MPEDIRDIAEMEKMTKMSNYQDLLDKLKPGKEEPLEPNSKVLLVDGMNCFYRCFTVINHVNSDLIHIGGLTGFLKSVGYTIKICQPTKVIIILMVKEVIQIKSIST